MAGLTVKQFDSPDETRTPDKSKMEVLELASVKTARLTPPARMALVRMHQARCRR